MSSPLVDRFGRKITYLRFSLTDRCDFRCVYCMAEDMTFLPRQKILGLEEMLQVAETFVSLGVKKIRLTGGEPLIRHNVIWLIERLTALPGLDELLITSNGSQLVKYAPALAKAGVKRINVSLDTLDPTEFKQLTRTGDIKKVLAGINAAQQAGIERIKLNVVVMKGRNQHQILPLVDYALANKVDVSFIEEMPLGAISEHQRGLTLCTSEEVRDIIQQQYQLMPSTYETNGPSRYWQIPGYQSKIGFISPHSHNFCGDCNRVRVTAEGKLLLCLGNEHSADLKNIIRRYPGEQDKLRETIITAMDLKPERHYFDPTGDVQLVRFMNMTGG
ncbi:GTP 3',8-cyclase MoaA [Spartinivicinus poritis]|uniref:GTP 3',8-cyclase n=1 Tax=Spartinivicinus poritis TaxID=2994640 RepID=A0ABT5UEP8_9GAMM|nr:GTP 3',8-cyclase MoaA [Spartinivicinus sp. A2-2]MDE1464857.1 GTP 3',8-cyclase MoaA [Spartinivicinus sp. A2-2]